MLSPEATPPVTILGAGIVGICTALSLLERGMSVRLVDRGAPGQETSMGNAGVVSPWSVIPASLPGTWKTIPKMLLGHGRPLSIHPKAALRMIPWGMRFLRNGNEPKVRATAQAMSLLCGPSIELYQKHLRDTGHENLLTESHYIHAFRDGDRATLSDLDYRIRRELGADVELVGRNELAGIEPALSPDFEAAVVIKGQARVRSPGRLGAVLSEKAMAQGAQFHRANIRKLRHNGSGWDILCDGDTLTSDRIIMCLGAWSPGLLNDTALSVPMMAERGYHVQFKDPGVSLTHSIMDVDAKVVASSMEGGLRVAGQADFAPIDAPPNPRKRDRLIAIAKAAIPDLRVDEPTIWMGRRPSFPDSLPMLGAVAGQPGLFLNFGHSHHGLMMAPKSGEVLARLVAGDRENADLSAFSPARF